MKDKIVVLVESANINAAFNKIKSIKNIPNDAKLDIAKLVDAIIVGNDVVSKRIYLETRDTNDQVKQRRYHDHLRHSGFEVIAKPVKPIRQEDGSIKNKANFDVEITLDARDYFWRRECNKFVLFSGDSDFTYLLNKLNEHDIKVDVVSSQNSVSSELRDRASRLIFLEELDLKNMLSPK